MTNPPQAEPQYDLAGGDTPPARDAKTIAEVLTEAKSRRLHRRAAAVLIYSVVLCLIASVVRVVWKVSTDLVHINPAVVGLVASLVFAISVLTIALARYAYGMSNAGDGKPKSESDVTGPPAVEAVKLMGDLLSKVGDIFKSFKA